MSDETTLEDKHAYALDHVERQVDEALQDVKSQEAWVVHLERDVEEQRVRLVKSQHRLEAMQELLAAAKRQWTASAL